MDDNKKIKPILLPETKLINSIPHETEEGVTRYRFKGIPWDAPLDGIYSLHGTFFTKKTDYGKPNTVTSYLEHGMFPLVGFEPMGYATMLDDPELENKYNGKIFDILVRQSNEYHDLLAALEAEGRLYGSVQLLNSGFAMDWYTGEVFRAIPAEYSFTVSPAIPNAEIIEVVTNSLSSYKFDPKILNTFLDKKRGLYNMPQEETNVDEVVEETEEVESTDESTEESLEQEIIAINDEVETSEEQAGRVAEQFEEAINSALAKFTEGLTAALDERINAAFTAHLEQYNAALKTAFSLAQNRSAKEVLSLSDLERKSLRREVNSVVLEKPTPKDKTETVNNVAKLPPIAVPKVPSF